MQADKATITMVEQAEKTDALQVGLDYINKAEEGDAPPHIMAGLWLQLGTALEIRQVVAQLAALRTQLAAVGQIRPDVERQ